MEKALISVVHRAGEDEEKEETCFSLTFCSVLSSATCWVYCHCFCPNSLADSVFLFP